MATTANAPPAGADAFAENAPLMNISCFDLLLIELVPLAERMARAFEASLDRPAPGGGGVGGGASTKQQQQPQQQPQRSSTAVVTSQQPAAAVSNPTTASVSGAGAGAPPLAADGLPETDIYRDSMYVRLERLGFRVGEGLTERFSRDRPRFTDQLDVIKFLCKDLWTVVFKKQIDNLKTNHRVCIPCTKRPRNTSGTYGGLPVLKNANVWWHTSRASLFSQTTNSDPSPA